MEKINLTRASVYVVFQTITGKFYPADIQLELIYCKNRTEFDFMCRRLFGTEWSKLVYFDYENIPDVYITTNWICPELFPLIRFLSELSSGEQTAFSLWLDVFRPYLGEITPKDLHRMFRYSFEGCFPSKQYFGEYKAYEDLAITTTNSPRFNVVQYTHFLFEQKYLFREGYVFKL